MNDSPPTKTAYLVAFLVSANGNVVVERIGVFSEATPTSRHADLPVVLMQCAAEDFYSASVKLRELAAVAYRYHPHILELLPSEVT